MSQEISHATLSDRELRDQHGISSISGLGDALSTLAANDHETRRYAYDAMHASHSSIHHASVAVAEAAYIESILNKIDTLHQRMEQQMTEVNTMIRSVDDTMHMLDQSITMVETAASNAQASATQAAASAAAANAVSQTVEQFRSLLEQAMTQIDAINTAAGRAETAAQNAENVSQNIQLSVEQAAASAQTASQSADAATNAAQNVMSRAEQAVESATTAAAVAESASSAVASIVEAVNQYVASARDAEVSANEAATAASEAVTARTGMDELVAAAQDYCERAERASESNPGTMHYQGQLGAVSCLPQLGVDVGDIWYCAEEHAYYIYTQVGWRIMSNVAQWAAVSENEPPSQASMAHFREGSVFTIITGDADQQQIETPGEEITTVILHWVGIVNALPDGTLSSAGDACLYDGQIYMFEDDEWAPISDAEGETSWQLYADTITEEEIAAITQALNGTEPVVILNQEENPS